MYGQLAHDGGFGGEKDLNDTRRATRHALVGAVRRSIHLHQLGGAPSAHGSRGNLALTEFAPSYHRATVTQVSLASVGFLSALVAWKLRLDSRWLIGGGLLVSGIPFTAVAILPTNKQLLDPETANDLELAERLLTRWGRLHAVRSVLSLASLLTFLFLLGKRRV